MVSGAASAPVGPSTSIDDLRTGLDGSAQLPPGSPARDVAVGGVQVLVTGQCVGEGTTAFERANAIADQLGWPHAYDSAPRVDGLARARGADRGRQHRSVVATDEPSRPAPARRKVLAGGSGILATALLLRLTAFRSAYDVFIDESIYAGIANNIAVGRGLTYEGRDRFFLHPPLLFGVDSVWLRLVGAANASPVAQVFAGRVIGCIFGAVNAVLVTAIVRRVVGTRVGIVAGLAYALEPFVIRFDTRVFLEAPTMTWLLAGLLVLLPLASTPVNERHSLRGAAGGMFFGLALLTKEPSAILFGVPLAYCIARGTPIGRKESATALAAAALTYLPYPLIASVLNGPQWFDQKTLGVRRLLGYTQETGFNRAGSPSFTGRLLAQLPYFGSTYAVIGLGLLASGYILARRSRPQQLLALWGMAAFALLFYQVALGTLEEQMFYFLVIPALVNVGVAVGGTSWPVDTGRAEWVRPLAVILLSLYFVQLASVWTRVHTTPDTEVSDTVTWMSQHVPTGDHVLALADGLQLVLPNYRVEIDPALGSSPGAWVITSSLQIEQGYGFARPADMELLRRSAQPAFRVQGRSMGDLVVWRLGDRPAG